MASCHIESFNNPLKINYPNEIQTGSLIKCPLDEFGYPIDSESSANPSLQVLVYRVEAAVGLVFFNRLINAYEGLGANLLTMNVQESGHGLNEGSDTVLLT